MAQGALLVVLTAVPRPVSPGERQRLGQLGFGSADAADNSLIARALAARLVSQRWQRPIGQLRFAATDTGKPIVHDGDGAPGPAFSLSHTDGWVAVAVADRGAVGVDIQAVTTPAGRVNARVLAEPDREMLQALPPAEAADQFTRLWTIAEACAKADGAGLSLLLAGFAPIGAAPTGRWRRFGWWSGAMPGGRWAVAADGISAGATPAVSELSLSWVLDDSAPTPDATPAPTVKLWGTGPVVAPISHGQP
jgi:4'-phosphopantetheinyl transferase